MSVQVVALLVLFGVVSAADKATFEGGVTKAVENVFALITAATAAWKYVQSRTDVKVG